MSNPQFCMSHRQTMIGVLAWGPLKRRLDFAWAALLYVLSTISSWLLMDFHIQDFSILQFDSPAFDFYWSEWSIESIWGHQDHESVEDEARFTETQTIAGKVTLKTKI